MRLSIVPYAQARKLLGFERREVECESSDTPRQIVERLQAGASLDYARVAIDYEYHGWDQPVGLAKEMALIPPVSGG